MLEIILVRHGISEGNIYGVYHGASNHLLSDAGRRMSAVAGDRLKSAFIQEAFVSTLSRAVESAEIICSVIEHKGPVTWMSELNETNFGAYEGYTFERLQREDPEGAKKLSGPDWMNYRFPNGESALETYERVIRGIDRILAKYDDGRVLIVAHAGAIRFALCYLLDLDIEFSWRFKVDFCRITRVEMVNNYACLRLFNG